MKTRKIGSFLGLGAFALLGSPALHGVARAQESLAGLGAASAMGATLGASAATSFNTSRVPRGVGAQNALIDEAGNAGGPAGANPGGPGAANAEPVASLPIPQSYGLNARKLIMQLRNAPSTVAPQGGLPRQTETKAARQRRLARLSPAERKKAIQQQYKIPPVGWLGRYLPQDRYKFGKDWQFVSTEDSKYYFSPQGLATRRFNPNRVIGFRTWQDAMLAGYQPDPVSKPMPAPELVSLSKALTSQQKSKWPEKQPEMEPFYRFVEYIYAGQVSTDTTLSTLRYAEAVHNKLASDNDTRWQARAKTITAIMRALRQVGPDELMLAGTPEFEAKLIADKQAIINAVQDHNEEVYAKADDLALAIAFPTRLNREVAAIQADLMRLSDIRQLPQYQRVYGAALRVAQKVLGPLRNSQSEINTMVSNIRTKGSSGRVRSVVLPPFTKVSTPSFAVKVGTNQKGAAVANFAPEKEPWVRNGYWKFVSSDVSKVVYRPNDPRARAIPASRVIGFHTATDVLEAGYTFAPGTSLAAESRRATAKIEQRAEVAKKAAAAAAPQAGAQPGAAGAQSAGQAGVPPMPPGAGMPPGMAPNAGMPPGAQQPGGMPRP